MPDQRPTSAPDFTFAAIFMIGVNLMWIFFVIWALYGLVPVIVLALLINHVVDRIAERRGRRPAFARDRRPPTAPR